MPMVVSLQRCIVIVLFVGWWSTSHADAKSLTYPGLKDLINEKQLTQLEQVLAHLPEDMVANYTLVYDSQSLQESSHEYPRAILFGRDAKMVLTFDGDPAQRKYHELELMWFRDDIKNFELRSISFKNGVQFSKANPTICLSCHGVSPRPVWDSYDYSKKDALHWRGVYGSIHDAPVKDKQELERFKRFKALATTHPRYRYLKLTHPKTPWYPYGRGPFQHQFRPNNRLGNLLARLNANKIAYHLKKRSFYKKYQNTSLLWLLSCAGAKTEKFEQKIEKLFPQTFDRKYNKRIYGDLKSVNTENRLAFMFEKLLSGSDIYTWNMTLNTSPGGVRFSTGILSIDQLVAAALLSEVANAKSWLASYYRPASNQAVYDTFKKGYYELNVKPGGVGAVYDALALYYEEPVAQTACGELARRAQLE